MLKVYIKYPIKNKKISDLDITFLEIFYFKNK